MNADGSNLVRLTEHSSPLAFDWSPDGTRVAFVLGSSPPEQVGDVYLVNADGTGLTRLTNNAGGFLLAGGISGPSIAWSPNGQRLALVRDFGDLHVNAELWVVNADEAGLARIAGPPAYAPAWQPQR